MPRPPRLDLPGVAQHVVQRGNNRTECFFGDADRRFYLKCLAESAARRGCEVHAYALMSNHVHILATPNASGAIGMMVQDVGRRYVRVINTLHARTGTLWEARFRSSLIDSENYLLVCQRYIELNPVRAGIVTDPAAYPWSSHTYYASGRANRLVTEHDVYLRLGSSAAERRSAYLSLFAKSLDDVVVARIREAINSDSAFGSDAFLDDAEAKLGRSVRLPVRGRPAKSVTGKLL
jgi:REP-associated tyrosine transposase